MDKSQYEKELKDAADGLLMLSETETPLEFFWQELPDNEVSDTAMVARWGGKASGKDVHVEELDYFFRNMTNPHPDAGDAMHQISARYKQLVAKLKDLLEDVKVYKMENQGFDVFIIGKTPSGEYAGYRTLVVET
ncbi:nuclease A inhibitor family protein [Pontibacter sp. 13R65]|uniref:nuclease A inhibitor family protein n=1 Tax=Pontibacter sp. 13R65 TaxID=3127458 RepID=UPI00301BECBC